MKKAALFDCAKFALGAIAGFGANIVILKLLAGEMGASNFGVYSLCVGVALLVRGVIFQPVYQAVFTFHNNFGSEKWADFSGSAFRYFLISVSLISIIALVIGFPNRIIVCILIVWLVGEYFRGIAQVYCLAKGMQGKAAISNLADAFIKMLFVWIATKISTENVVYVLAGWSLSPYFAVAIMPFGIVNFLNKRLEREDELKIIGFSWPIAPQNFLGWLIGLADRYVIGALCGTYFAGIYSGFYALGSQPINQFQLVVENVSRPNLLSEISNNQRIRCIKRILTMSLLVLLIALASFAFLLFFGADIAGILLGKDFEKHWMLILWVVIGQGLISISANIKLFFLSYGSSKKVLAMDFLGGGLSVAVPYFLVTNIGWKGASYAIPIYGLIILIGYSCLFILHFKEDFIAFREGN